MAMHAALLSGLVVMAQAAGPPSPVFLACSMPANGVTAERIFRVAPGSFQEWDAAKQDFGKNFCEAFACSKTPERMEGSISSASVSYTVGIVNDTGEGYWRAAGASGLSANKGACRVVPAPTPRGR